MSALFSAQASTGGVVAWGQNQFGQVGNGASGSTKVLVPTSVSGLSAITSVAAGGFHNLALSADGSVFSWGNNSNGQLGTGTTTGSPLPVPVKGISGIRAIAAGDVHSAAIDARGTDTAADDTVWTWGSNSCGQLGVAGGDSLVPVQVMDPADPSGLLTGVIAVAAGGFHNLALKADGSLWAWGNNSTGQLGNGMNPNPALFGDCSFRGPRTDVPSPPRTPPGVPNPFEESPPPSSVQPPPIGLPLSRQETPSRVALDQKVLTMAAGGSHSLALTEDGSVWAWGNNSSGQLGSPVSGAVTVINSGTPLRVSGLPATVSMLAAGAAHSLALADGKIWGWGENKFGQLGDGTTFSNDPPFQYARVQPRDPVLAKSLSNAVYIDAGDSHSLAVTSDGKAWAWGWNSFGQVGDGTTAHKKEPALLSTLTEKVASMTGGRTHSVALFGEPRVPMVGPRSPVGGLPIGLPRIPPTPSTTAPPQPEVPSPPVRPQPPPPPDGGALLAKESSGTGGVFVTGRGPDVQGIVGCPVREYEQSCRANLIGAQNFIRRSVAYVTPKEAAPRLLYVPDRSSPAGARGLEVAGFSHPCPLTTPPAAPGCFDTALNRDQESVLVLHPYYGAAKDLNTVRFEDYDAVTAGSNLVIPEMDAMEKRRQELLNYVNRGGGLLVFKQSAMYGTCGNRENEIPECYGRNPNNPTEYQERLRFLPFLDDRFYRPDQWSYAGYTLTDQGRATGLSEADINGYLAYKWFFESCGFDVIELDKDKKIVSMATRQPIPTACSGLSAPDQSVIEGNSGTVRLSFPIKLGTFRSEPITINFVTADESAKGGVDYLASSGAIVFAPGEEEKSIDVFVKGDLVPEGNETFAIQLSSAELKLEASIVGTIIDDDTKKSGPEDAGPAGGGGTDSGKNASETQLPSNPAAAKGAAPGPAVAPAVVVPAPALAQALAQAQSQAQASSSSHAQASSQAHTAAQAPALSDEKEKERDLEKAHISTTDELLASNRTSSPVLPVILLTLGLATALGAGFGSRWRSHAGVPEYLPSGQKLSSEADRLRRLRGQR